MDVLDKPVVPDDLDDEECGNPVPCPSFFIKFVIQQKVGGWLGLEKAGHEFPMMMGNGLKEC